MISPPATPILPLSRSSASSSSSSLHKQVLEPRPQVALPHSPPLTPPTHKDRFGSISLAIPPPSQVVAPQSPAQSPKVEFAPTAASFFASDLPGADSSTIGLGLGFSEKGYSKAECDEQKRLASANNKQPRSPSSVFSPVKISNPYMTAASVPPGMSAIAYLVRVPRRLRPVLLLATSVFILSIVYLSRSVSGTSHAVDSFLERQAASHGRRFVAAPGDKQVVIDSGASAYSASISRYAASSASATSTFQFANKKDELLSLIGFITAATGNSLPVTIDPSVPLEPSVLLGFNPTADAASDDVEFLKEEVNTQYPLVLFGRMRDPWHNEVTKLLEHYKITPEPLIIDVDQRDDADTFIAVLERLLGSPELPQLLLLGEPLGLARDILALEEPQFKGTLIASSTVSVRDLTKKDKHRREKERQERERILGPAPITDA